MYAGSVHANDHAGQVAFIDIEDVVNQSCDLGACQNRPGCVMPFPRVIGIGSPHRHAAVRNNEGATQITYGYAMAVLSQHTSASPPQPRYRLLHMSR
jgi:hypothetical protein